MTNLSHQKIKFSKTAHFYTLGQLQPSTKYIWFVCHGYGQAADKFIQKFNGLDFNSHFIIAPEGLSRFYWNGFTGDVVATWMTSKDRLEEIKDYIEFLKEVRAQFLDSGHNAQWIALGFSQGVSTILRYLAAEQPLVSMILLWAGVLPPELDYQALKSYLDSSDLHYFYGAEDEFINEKRLMENVSRVRDLNIGLSLHTFQGTHKIDRQTLEEFVTDQLK